MPGHTGKRAVHPKACFVCGQPIKAGKFMRDKNGDSHEICWWAHRAPPDVARAIKETN